MLDRIHWLGHGSFVIDATPRIYVNPRRIPRTEQPADIILISHDHHHQFSPADVEKLSGTHTLILGNERVRRELNRTTVLRPWQSVSFGRACIKAVPAYSPRDSHHPREHRGLGFIISINFYDIYYAGDTQIIPEMEQIHPDIALLPIDGRGTLTVSEAAQVVRQMHPRWVIPYNWGSNISGATRIDAQRLGREVGETAQVVMPDMALAFT